MRRGAVLLFQAFQNAHRRKRDKWIYANGQRVRPLRNILQTEQRRPR